MQWNLNIVIVSTSLNRLKLIFIEKFQVLTRVSKYYINIQESVKRCAYFKYNIKGMFECISCENVL